MLKRLIKAVTVPIMIIYSIAIFWAALALIPISTITWVITGKKGLTVIIFDHIIRVIDNLFIPWHKI